MNLLSNRILLLFLVLLGVCGEACSDGLVKIGVITDLSGSYAQYGEQTMTGVKLAEKVLNQRGKAVQVIVEDNGLSTMRSADAAQKLLEVDKVDALYVDFAAPSIAVSSLVKAKKKIMIYAAAVRSVLRDNPYTFRTYLDYSDACAKLAKELRKTGSERLAVLKAEAEYGELCLQGVRSVLPGVTTESYISKEPVQAQLLRMKGRGIEAIINAAYETDILNMFQAASNIGYAPSFGMPQEALSDSLCMRFSEAMKRSLVFGMPDVAAEIVSQAIEMRKGEKLQSYERMGLAYVHIEQLTESLSSCSSREVECVVKRMEQCQKDPRIDFQGWRERSAVFDPVLKRGMETFH